ncbi:phosphomannomutase/phosphoglucomutase [Ramlibacter tataouinensis]|uniref:Phosphomannomutase/phosphoglucomutase-like protein n=1 Tax=Ramlibacter tataouinensis (strain ATCC BAA-407 / DSM 14655 / LMG 21543 / TTB310) TaxID=365046 RepID=F5XX05_RAMTT|nr:phosphomannomutase/phosphoglucomutase [Ramlibacter tataouinensis]AEG91766.1 Phosphomannomutase/phosphoglucomutase-like protein [Ramlibacter tataouinensis TTB310]
MQAWPGIFKAYDIRGVVPATLDEPLSEALGRVFGSLAREQGERVVAVGRDGRLSGPALAQALVRGLLAAGIDVIDLGMVTTPMLYFATSTLARSGIQVTASHNPREHNGFKMVLAGRTVHGEAIQQLRRRIERGEWNESRPPGEVRQVEVAAAYRDRIAGDIRLARPLQIVLDCGNGVAGASSPGVFRAIGCEVVELFSEVDGRFPNHHPDPAQPENLRDLIAAVQETRADLGLALDGDGDRLGVVTRGGHIIYPDRQMVLFARDVLSRHPGAPIVFDVKSTQRLPEAIAAAGGRPVMDRSGYVLLKDRMQALGAPLAGEMSGHLFFNDRWWGFDDGTYAGCRLLEILSRHPDAGAVLDALPASCSTPELHVPCAEGEAHRVAAELASTARFPDAQVCTIDGLRVDWPDGFGLVRASNTTPVLTVRFEGHTPEAMGRIERQMMDLLRRVKPDAAVAGGSR